MDKILKLQTEIGVLSKTETNPFFKSKYMDINGLLAQLLPLLDKHKLRVTQPLTNIEGKPAIATQVFDLDAKAVIVEEKFPLPEQQDPQKMGSAITYYRRYALQSLFLLQAEDDDGNHASKKKDEPELTPRQKAEKDIAEEEDIFGLRNLEDKIKKSTKLTDKDKEELAFIANERALELGPNLK